jgi:hypothetical protein
MGVSPGVTRQPYYAAVLLSSVTHWFTRKDLSDGLQNLGVAYIYYKYSIATVITPNGGYGCFLQNHYTGCTAEASLTWPYALQQGSNPNVHDVAVHMNAG